MSGDHLEVASATAKRARGYLRWYPSAWRARYGEEFVAHLEAELTDRPAALGRTLDIVAHGLLARLSWQRGVRILVRATVAFALVAAAAVGIVALSRLRAPIAITSGYHGGITGVGLFAPPNQVIDVADNFSTRSPVVVRITSVAVVPLRGFAPPEVVGVEFAPHASNLVNARGWPVRLPTSATVRAQGNVPPARVLGATVTLARTDVLWLGLRAPELHHAYAVEGLRVTYERHGVSHTFTINQSTSPDVLCASSSRAPVMPSWCSHEIRVAGAIAAYSTATHPPSRAASDEAQLIAQLALDEVAVTGHGPPTLGVVRHWADRLFPPGGLGAVRSVTSASRHEWRFVIHRRSGESSAVICTTRGQVTENGGVIGVGVQSCP